MKIVFFLFLIFSLGSLSGIQSVHAERYCKYLGADEEGIQDYFYMAKTHVPIKKYAEFVEKVELHIKNTDIVEFPFAQIDGDIKRISISKGFIALTCKLILGKYFMFSKNFAPFKQIDQEISNCLSKFIKLTPKDLSNCLSSSINAKDDDLHKKWINLSDQEKQTRKSVYRGFILTTFLHEIGHFALSHFKKGKLTSSDIRDLEIEADIFAVSSVLNTGNIPMGLAYLLITFGQLEKANKYIGAYEQEVLDCRQSFFMSSSLDFVGLTTYLHRFYGFGYKEPFDKSQNTLLPFFLSGDLSQTFFRNPECGKHYLPPMKKLKKELYEFYQFTKKIKEIDTSNLESMNSSISQLIDFSKKVESIKGLVYLAIHSLSNKLATRLDNPVYLNLMVKLSKNVDIPTSTFGRILQEVGTAILHGKFNYENNWELQKTSAKDLLKYSIHYNKYLAQAHAELAMIFLMEGECLIATHLGQKAIELANNQEEKKLMQEFTMTAFKAHEMKLCKKIKDSVTQDFKKTNKIK